MRNRVRTFRLAPIPDMEPNMEYWLIFFLILVALSPLAWLKSSPGQRRVTGFRNRARQQGLKVQLVPAIDADPAVTRPEAVRYLLSYPADRVAEMREAVGEWTLLKGQRRGWDSPWSGWTWFRSEAPVTGHPSIAAAIEALPAVAYGIRAEAAGVAVYLRETGDPAAVDAVAESLRTLRPA